jgi:hypothetical protein
MVTAGAKVDGAGRNGSVRGEPRVSIVVLSRDDVSELRRALHIVGPAAHDIGAQLIIARAGSDEDLVRSFRDHGRIEVAHAPSGTTRSELCDRAMALVRGDIVSLRSDAAIHDAAWIPGFTRRKSTAAPPVERLVPQAVQPLADVLRQADRVALSSEPAGRGVPLGADFLADSGAAFAAPAP